MSRNDNYSVIINHDEKIRWFAKEESALNYTIKEIEKAVKNNKKHLDIKVKDFIKNDSFAIIYQKNQKI